VTLVLLFLVLVALGLGAWSWMEADSLRDELDRVTRSGDANRRADMLSVSARLQALETDEHLSDRVQALEDRHTKTDPFYEDLLYGPARLGSPFEMAKPAKSRAKAKPRRQKVR